MKRYIGVITVLFALSFVLIACSNKNDSESEPTNNDNVSEESNDASSSEDSEDNFIDNEDFDHPMNLIFSSGVGAWHTAIELQSDGSFTGQYHDANAGASGEGHLATNYISEFTGSFGNIKKVDKETYSMKLLDISYEHEEDEEWIEGNTKYIATEAYGLAEGEDFFLYTPKKNIQDLNEELLSWGSVYLSVPNPPKMLQHWVLHNEMTDYGFYSGQYEDDLENESESNADEEALSSTEETLPSSFKNMEFDNSYNGPGSDFIGTWQQVNNSTVDFSPNPWEINFKDGIFYISAELPGDPATIIMTAEYSDDKLHSNNGTQIELMDYENLDTFEIDLPETVEAGKEISQFFFEDGYLQWNSELRGDFRDTEGLDGNFDGYEKE